MLSEAQNTKVVQDAYAAFGRGDIPALLGLTTEDIHWQPVIGTARHVPFLGRAQGQGRGRRVLQAGLRRRGFPAARAARVRRAGRPGGRHWHYRGTAKASGRTFESDFVMIFTFRDGNVAVFREFTDSAAINAAFA